MASQLETKGVPKGASAKVSIIDNSFLYNIPVDNYIQPIVPGYEKFSLPSYSFLVENSDGRKVLFDFGTRKDWDKLTPEALHEIEADTIKIEVDRDVLDILTEGGIQGADIEAVIFSHHHWDHIGNMSRMPRSTNIVVGPGFTKSFIPGYPLNKDSPILQTDHENHHIQEIHFDDSAQIQVPNVGAFKGFDYFGDGSLYLLDAPGHTIGHLCALARTTTSSPAGASDTFVFMGGDSCHHNGEFRPSRFRPLPHEISPHPILTHATHPCPGASWARWLRSKGRGTDEAFFAIPDTSAGAAYTHDVAAAKDTVARVQDMDSGDDVLMVMAHDASVKGVVDFFPGTVNEWKEKGWGTRARWAFLRDFRKVFDEFDDGGGEDGAK